MAKLPLLSVGKWWPERWPAGQSQRDQARRRAPGKGIPVSASAEMPRLSYVGFKVLPFMASKAKYAKRKVRMRAAHTANTARGTENKPRFPFCCGFRKWAPISRDNERATMKHIPTTATTVRKIQEAAKVIKKAAKISYMNALHQATQEAGYENWHHVLKCQAEPAPTKALPYERTQVGVVSENGK